MLRLNSAGRVVVVGATAFLALTFKEWSAVLSAQNGSTVSGIATAVPHASDTLVVNIRIKGARSGDVNPWHVHSGGCDGSGAVLGDPSRYAPMTTGADQTGQTTARIRAMLTIGVPYSVNVHRSPSDMTVIACGNLRPIAGG